MKAWNLPTMIDFFEALIGFLMRQCQPLHGCFGQVWWVPGPCRCLDTGAGLHSSQNSLGGIAVAAEVAWCASYGEDRGEAS